MIMNALDHAHHSPFEPVKDCARCWLQGEANTVDSLIEGMPPEAQKRYRDDSHPHNLLATLHAMESAITEVVRRFDAHGKPAGTVPFPLATSIDKLRAFVRDDA